MVLAEEEVSRFADMTEERIRKATGAELWRALGEYLGAKRILEQREEVEGGDDRSTDRVSER